MRVIVADDHGIVRESLKQYVLLLDPAAHIDDAASLADVLALAGVEPPVDMILLDLQMPGMRGAASLAEVRRQFASARIIVVSATVDKDVITDALRSGVNGYVTKTTHGQALVNALRLVLSGETYIPAAMLDAKPAHTPSPASALTFRSGSHDAMAKLSPREIEVLRKLVAGKTNRTIATNLGMQDATVKVHIRNIYRKIGAANRADAVNIVLTTGGLDALQPACALEPEVEQQADRNNDG